MWDQLPRRSSKGAEREGARLPSSNRTASTPLLNMLAFAVLLLLLPAIASAQATEWDWEPRDRSSSSSSWTALLGEGEGEENGSDAAQQRTNLWADFLNDEGIARASAATCEEDTVLESIEGDGELTLFAKSLSEVGLSEALGGSGRFTVFAPIDSAFANLDRSSPILQMDLHRVIEYHLSPDEVSFDLDTSQARGGRVLSKSLSALSGDPIEVEITPFFARVNGDTEILDDAEACNGRIVKITDILLPPPASPASKEKSRSSRDFPDQETSCDPRECCDVQPPDFSCEDQKAWGKCDENWIKIGKYCRKTCGFCYSSNRGDRPPANAIFQDGYETAHHYESRIYDDPLSDYTPKGLLYQQWTDIEGWRVSDMSKNYKILEEPTTTVVMDAGGDHFEAPHVYARNPSTVSRMSGFFCPPFSGDYAFTLSSDDSGRLYVASGPLSEKRRLAKISGYKRPSDRVTSPTVYMEKGQPQFLEAMQKQGDGPGHLRVGVQLPSGADLDPIPASYFSQDCGETKAKDSAVTEAEALPEMSEEEACGCTENGYSGSVEKRVNTHKKGCFTMDYREQLVGGAQTMASR